jgi:hypothetical protein
MVLTQGKGHDERKACLQMLSANDVRAASEWTEAREEKTETFFTRESGSFIFD